MGVRIVSGVGKKLLTSVFLKEINDAHDAGLHKKSRLLVIIPEQFSSYYEQTLASNKGFMDIEVMTFSRLVQRLFDLDFIQKAATLNDNGKAMMIYSLLNEHADILDVYKKSARHPGFSLLVKKTIDDLRNDGIDFSDLIKIADEQQSLNIKEKFHEIAGIYELYMKKLHEGGYSDLSDSFSYLSEYIERTTDFNDCIVWFDRFSYFTESQYPVVKSLMKKAKMINISLCMDMEKIDLESGMFYRPFSLLQRIKKECNELKIDFVVQNFISDKKDESDIDILSENLFKPDFKSYDNKPDSIEIYKAFDIYKEAEFTAINIMDNIVNEGARFKDILLVTSDLSVYEKVFNAVFSQYDIPYYINSKKSIYENPLIRFIILILDIFIWEYDSEYMIKFIKNIYSDYYEMGNIVYELENYILKWGISGPVAWHVDWDYQDSAHDEKMNFFRVDIVGKLDSFYNAVRKEITAEEFAGRLFSCTQKFNLSKKIELELVNRDNYEKEQAKQSYNSFIEILDQFVLISKDEKTSARHMMNILKTAFFEQTTGITPVTKDCVIITDTSRTDIFDYDIVHLLGVNEGVFPTFEQSSTLFNDNDIAVLKQLGFLVRNDSQNKTNDDNYIIFNLLQTTKNKLVLSNTTNNPDGSHVFESVLLSKIRNIFPNISITDVSDIPSYRYIFNYKTGFNMLKDTDLMCAGSDDDLNKCLNISSVASSVDSIKMTDKIFGKNIILSPTMIERYQKCPYSFLMEYGLKLKKRDVFEYFSVNLGNLKHAVIFDAMSDIAKQDTFEQSFERIYELCTKSAEKIGKTTNIYKRDSILEYVKERAITQATETIKYSLDMLVTEKLKPAYFEAEFNDECEFPPILYNLDQSVIKLIGKIDRIDSGIVDDNEYFRVIDYKSSYKMPELYKIKNGYDIQLALYAYVYNKITNASLTGFYYITVDHEFIGVKNSSDESYKDASLVLSGYSFDNDSNSLSDIIEMSGVKKRKIIEKSVSEDIFDSIENTVINTGKSILNGSFDVHPIYDNGVSACTYCPYDKLCGFKPYSGGYRYIEKEKDSAIEW